MRVARIVSLAFWVLASTVLMWATPHEAAAQDEIPLQALFYTSREIAQVGDIIQFFDLSLGTPTGWQWNFGDGATSTLQSPSHIYTALGTYSVTLTVTKMSTGETSTLTLPNWITITTPAFVEFTAQPRQGESPLTVNFTDLSVGDGVTGAAVAWQWDFGDGGTSGDQNPTHQYAADGTYDVSLTVTWNNGTTPPARLKYPGDLFYIFVGQVAEEEEPPTATLEAFDAIADKHTYALVPLNHWAPLFSWTMAWDSEDEPAPRVLTELQFSVGPLNDPDLPGELNRFSGLRRSDLYDFAIFGDVQGVDEEGFQVLDTSDTLIGLYRGDPFRFNPDGYQILADPLVLGNLLTPFTAFPGYTFDLIMPHPDQVSFPGAETVHWPEIKSGSPEPFPPCYHLAVRTSALWRNACSLSYIASHMLMQPYIDTGDLYPIVGDIFTNDEGENIDTHNPFDDEILDPGTGYTSSFTVWDFTGGPNTEFNDNEFGGNWNWPQHLYSPITEFRRPRWDVPGTAFDFVAGPWLELRRVIPLEQWSPLIGINAHGFSLLGDWEAHITEVNVILTDEGADPYGPAGNGGLNPRTGLNPFTRQSWAVNSDANLAAGVDFTYNGLGVWFDTNNSGLFDEPVANTTSGVTLTDHPLYTRGSYAGSNPYQLNPGMPQWEYIPFPPGGGAPWWKVKLLLSPSGRRRNDGDTPTGHLEPIPDYEVAVIPSSLLCDFFVVVRPDSGYKDSSLYPGDGTGATFGADFRAFVEPRRFNAATGFEDGGIHFSCMRPDRTEYNAASGNITFAWQTDPLWDLWNVDEPWWTQRTMNATTAKPSRIGGDIHDLVMIYETTNLYATITDNWYSEHQGGWTTMAWGEGGFGALSWWDEWLDPYGFVAGQFHDGHTVSVVRWIESIVGTTSNEFDSIPYPYETVPFFNPEFDVPPYGPRSAFYTDIPAQPTLPTNATWPVVVEPGKYPRESQWLPANRRARVLRQHIQPLSHPTAMLGLNLIGADDPVVNQFNRLWLNEVTVAFWGPDFMPSDLRDLDPDGTNQTSGVLLVEDASGDGVFGQGTLTQAMTNIPDPLTVDRMVPLQNLRWSTAPQWVDITGDGIADDMDGNGVITDADKCWLVTLKPRDAWPVPVKDASGGYTGYADGGGTGGGAGGTASVKEAVPAALVDIGDSAVTQVKGADHPVPRAQGPVGRSGTDYWGKTPQRVSGNVPLTKAIGPSGNGGDDLFVVVQSSKTLSRFEQFRAMVPAYAPARHPSESSGSQLAGMKFTPQTPISLSVYKKFHPEEGPVQEYFGPELHGFDMMEADIYCDIQNIAGSTTRVFANSGPLPLLGLDVSTNRGRSAGTLASGAAGAGATGTFTVIGSSWTAGRFTGCFLIDSAFESYEITGNTTNTLYLRSGRPRDGAWFIACNPTFLEQVIVELYDEGRDGRFNLQDDLMPLSIDQTVSGVALYRDNDFHPANTNGVFDPGIDLPVPLDYAPFQIGQTGEPNNQVMFIFSTPGTDNQPILIEQQARNRQWVPDTLGTGLTDPELGPDFFVVIRTSSDVAVGDDFRVAVVSVGPNTPTEPDPDTFPPPPATRVGEFDLFSEFPWGHRAVGFITFFSATGSTEAYYPRGYSLAADAKDNSGFQWVRHNANRATQTDRLAVTERVPEEDDVVIRSVSPSTLPKNVPAAGITLTISGSSFGTSPTVTLDGVTLTVTSAASTLVQATIPGGTILDSNNDNIIVLTLRNAGTGKSASYSAFTITGGGVPGNAPSITSVSPNRGGSGDFPVTVLGTQFDEPLVFFDQTSMPVQSWTATRIVLSFPPGGLPKTGALDVTVRNSTTSLSDVALDAFTYSNPVAGRPTGSCFVATAAFGTPFAGELDTFRAFRDGVLLKSAAGTALVDTYYSVSPPIADAIAAHPWLAALVRGVLTPVAWMLRAPLEALLLIAAALAAWSCHHWRSRACVAR